MMPRPLSEGEQTRLAVSCLFVAFVRTLAELDKSVVQRFDDEIGRMYNLVRDYPTDTSGTMETLKSVHDMLKE